MDSHLTPLWQESLKGAVCLFHQRQRTEPELKYWHRKAVRDLIHNSTDENMLFSGTSEKEMSVALSKKALTWFRSFGWLRLHCDLLH